MVTLYTFLESVAKSFHVKPPLLDLEPSCTDYAVEPLIEHSVSPYALYPHLHMN
jgi:hypothetical protein